MAVKREDVDSVALALERFPDVSPDIRINKAIDTAAHFAVRKDNVDLLTLLIKFHANLTIKNGDKKTALELAEALESWKCYEVLAANDSDEKPSVGLRK